MLRRVGDRIEDQLVVDATRHRARRHAQIQYLLREALEGWERSQRDQVRRRQRQAGTAIDPNASAAARAALEVTVETRDGDPRFLREAKDLVFGSAGLDPTPPPTAVARPPALDLSKLTDEEVAQLERLLARATGNTPSPTQTDTRTPTDESEVPS
jgi:hypothetical protein